MGLQQQDINDVEFSDDWDIDANGNFVPDASNPNGELNPARFAASGTDLEVTDLALSAGFGTTASAALVGAPRDFRGIVDVASSGTGQGANPTLTLTFKDGAFAAAPVAVAIRGDLEAATGLWRVTAQTTTTVTFTFVGTPVAAQTYRLLYQVLG